MSNPAANRTITGLFPANDVRMRVLAMCGMSLAKERETIGWTWLLVAEAQKKALLYSGMGQLQNPEDAGWAALGALGEYLGFPALVVALMPGTMANVRGMPKTIPAGYVDKIRAHFEVGGHDPQKSRLIIGPDIIARWPGGMKLRTQAAAARLAGGAPTCSVLDSCPKCGEFIVDGECGCGRSTLGFPNFHSPIGASKIKNLVLKFGMQDWLGKFDIDYCRKVRTCPDCQNALIPVDAGDIRWKCSKCGAELSRGREYCPERAFCF